MPYGILKADTLTYYTASGDISIPVSGIAATVSGTIAVPSGTAAAPSISYVGDPDTGFYSPGANQVAIATSGTGRVFVDASGLVDVITSGNAGSIRIANETADATTKLGRIVGRPYTNADGDFLAFDIRGTSTVENSINYGGGSALLKAVNLHVFFTAPDTTTAQGFERLRITSDGKVGIGTNAPVATLQVIATSGSTAHQVNTSGGGIFTTIFDNSTAYQLAFTGVTNAITAYAVGTQSTIPFSILTSNTERINVSSSGVVTVKNGAVAEIGTLTDGATITPNFAANCNFTVTISGNRTIANPTNITAGQAGSIFIVQGSGSNTVSWGSYWDFPSGTAPTLSTASGAVDRVDYIVRTATSIHTVFTANYS